MTEMETEFYNCRIKHCQNDNQVLIGPGGDYSTIESYYASGDKRTEITFLAWELTGNE